MEKAALGFCIYKIWQILKRFAGTFRQAQTLKLGGVSLSTKKGANFVVGAQIKSFSIRRPYQC